MSHDSTKIRMGTVLRGKPEITTEYPGTSVPGQAWRLKSDGTLSKAVADGELMGIDGGVDMGYAGKIALIRRGYGVPVKLKAEETLAKGDVLGIDDVTGEAAAVTTGVSASNAVVVVGSAAGMKGILDDGTEIDVVLVDMEGGL
jgi:hypothetical protein